MVWRSVKALVQSAGNQGRATGIPLYTLRQFDSIINGNNIRDQPIKTVLLCGAVMKLPDAAVDTANKRSYLFW